MTGFELWIFGVGNDHSSNCPQPLCNKIILLASFAGFEPQAFDYGDDHAHNHSTYNIRCHK